MAKKETKIYCEETELKYELTQVNTVTEYKESPSNELIEKYNLRKLQRLEEIRNKEDYSEEHKNNLLELTEKRTIFNHNKEILGKFILDTIYNILKKPCFSSYTGNWRDEFISLAIFRVLKYMSGFDENKISERTGKPIKAFAYLTQIIFSSILNVITQRKEELELIEKQMPILKDMSIQDVHTNYVEKTRKSKPYILEISADKDNVLKELNETLKELQDQDKIKSEIVDTKIMISDIEFDLERTKDQDLVPMLDEYKVKLGILETKYKRNLEVEEIVITIKNPREEVSTELISKLKNNKYPITIKFTKDKPKSEKINLNRLQEEVKKERDLLEDF